MTPKPAESQASAELSLAELLNKPAESHNERTVSSLNLIQSRFWVKVAPANERGCRLWLAASTGGGGMKHGDFTFPRVTGQPQRHIKAHRFAWLLAHGTIPAGLCVLHHCDEPLCVNSDHLFLGTQGDNVLDCARKGRFRAPRTRSLSLADRLTIFAAPRRRGHVVALAQTYGVTTSCISLIRRGRFVGAPFVRLHARQRLLRAGTAALEQPLCPLDAPQGALQVEAQFPGFVVDEPVISVGLMRKA